MTDDTATGAELSSEARRIELENYDLQEQLVRLRTRLSGQTVDDMELQTAGGARRLGDFFGVGDLLVVIHNMGRRCSRCTTCADGLNGVLPHLRDMGEVLLVSPDEPAEFQEFAESRGWEFQLATLRGSDLSAQLKFEPEPAGYPGICVLAKDAAGAITVRCRDDFEPSDRYSPAWHVAALVGGSYENTWKPRVAY